MILGQIYVCSFGFGSYLLTKERDNMKGRKTGGRKKGTPNKVGSALKEQIREVLDAYQSSGQMSEDFMSIEPRERLTIAEKLMGYILPKMKSVDVDMRVEQSEELKSARDTLRAYADEEE